MTHHFQTEHYLPVPVERVFLFFANPTNLPRIMPPSSGAQLARLRVFAPPGIQAASAIVTDQGPVAGVGSEIVVSIRVLPLLPLRIEWVSEIIEFEWNSYFADIQKKGPFKRFHHRHELRSEHGGTVVRDAIDYEVGFGWLGVVANLLFVAAILRRTFRFRQRAVEQLLTPSTTGNSRNV
jgi:ligand-binding SRPBCC domain-containing protein